MNLRDYFFGIRVDLVSPHSPEETARRINSATPSMFNIAARGVGGWCRFGRLWLVWRTPFFHNGFAPILTAKVRKDMSGALIRGSWGAPNFTRIWFAFWSLMTGLVLLLVLAGLFGAAPWNDGEGAMLLILPFFFLAPFGVAALSIRNGDERLREVLRFLADKTNARPA